MTIPAYSMNKLTELLGCRFPIIQGAMAVISNPELVAAVSEAGGFGLMATAFMDSQDVLQHEIERVKLLTDKPFGANLAPFNPLSKRFAEIIAENGLTAVTISAGPPDSLLPYFQKKGVKVLQVVANVTNALKAEKKGVDAVIAEGLESGGFQGPNGISTMVLVPAVADTVKIPVVAAGGIGDVRGFRASLALGAQGVQVGTRFIASDECIAHINYKNAIVETPESGTTLLKLGKMMARVIQPLNFQETQDKEVENMLSLTKIMEKAWLEGHLEQSAPAVAGQVTGLIHKIDSIEKIINEMVS